jgi:hypothetical protein
MAGVLGPLAEALSKAIADTAQRHSLSGAIALAFYGCACIMLISLTRTRATQLAKRSARNEKPWLFWLDVCVPLGILAVITVALLLLIAVLA